MPMDGADGSPQPASMDPSVASSEEKHGHARKHSKNNMGEVNMGASSTAAGLSAEDEVERVFDVFAADCDRLVDLAAAVFRKSGCCTAFDITADRLRAFILAVKATYGDNPYHNWYGI